MRLAVLLGLLGATAACGRLGDPRTSEPALASAPFDHGLVTWTGRVDRSSGQGTRMAWSATTATVRFRGESLRVRLRDAGHNVFQVVIDGQPVHVLATDPKNEEYTLAQGLSSGEHELSLVKRTEPRVGEVEFLGFEPAASLTMPPAPRTRRIEFIGDSITAAFGNEGKTNSCLFTPGTQNAFESYAAITARALDADHVNISWSGRTIGGVTDLWERTLPDGGPWDFSSWVPDAVVINLGTNNFSHGDPGEARFVQLYTRLLDRVRQKYPRAFIVCALGPMLTDAHPKGGQQLTKARAYTRAAVAEAQQRGDTQIAFVEFRVQDVSTAGCACHPSVATHHRMAGELLPVLQRALHW